MSILKSPFFWLGIGIRVVVVWILFAVGLDLNDMNELLMKANTNLLAGISPYSTEYTLTMPVGPVGGDDGTYQYPLSYPPVLLVVYLLPTVVYPHLVGTLQFSPTFFITNALFTFLASFQFLKTGNRAESVVGWVYWCGPWWPLVEYMTFYSFLFTMMVVAFHKIDDHFVAPLCIFLAIGAYHILIFLLPVLLVYQIYELGDGGVQDDEKHLLPVALLKNVLGNLKRDWTPVRSWLLASLPAVALVGTFLVWDFQGMYQSLVGRQLSRFGIDILQVVVVLVAVVLALSLLFVRDSSKVKFLATLFGIVTLLLESIYLTVKDEYHLTHFYGLFVPLVFVLVKNIIYDLGLHDELARKFGKKRSDSRVD
ncbi:MAG: hypothetical protein ACTSU5_00905 [Promethearchaeota archaeon]